jgi:hypothetical protein
MFPEPIFRDPFFFFAGAVNRYPFADHIAVADLDPRGAAAKRNILRLAADRNKRIDSVVFAQRRDAVNADVGDQAIAASNRHIRPDHAIRTYFHVVGELRAGIDARGICDNGSHA